MVSHGKSKLEDQTCDQNNREKSRGTDEHHTIWNNQNLRYNKVVSYIIMSL